jgi:hypothetical protein
MPGVGRKRTKDLQLLPGVRLIGERLFWQPTAERERLERLAAGLKISEPLGAAVRIRGRVEMTEAQRKTWGELQGHRDEDAEEGSVGELLALWEKARTACHASRTASRAPAGRSSPTRRRSPQ